MAGVVGRVPNRSGFASYTVKNWQDWMTEAVILHASGVSIAELSVKYDRITKHLHNLLNTSQAKAIVDKMRAVSLAQVHGQAEDNMKRARLKALDRINSFLDDDELARTAPATVWQMSLKTMDVMKDTTPVQAQTFNQQNNYFLPPDVLAKLKSAPTLDVSGEVPKNVESPTGPRRSEKELLGSGVRKLTDQGQDGPSLPMQWRTEPTN